jgi:uncharacterized protein (DUF4415 family)
MKNGKQVYMPTDQEGAMLTAAALSDADNPPLTDEQLSQMRPASEVLPPELFAGLVAMSKGGRPKAEQTKQAVTVRYDADVVAQFKAGGKGWQTRMNNALREWLNTHKQSPV